MSEVVKITGDGESCWAMAWAPDSQGIAQDSELWKVSVEGGEPQKLWKMAGSLKWLSVHPDGQRLAFTSQTWHGEIWLMKNFLPEIKTKK